MPRSTNEEILCCIKVKYIYFLILDSGNEQKWTENRNLVQK